MRHNERAEHTEMAVPNRHTVTIPAAEWEKFEEWVNAPVKTIPALRRLAATRPASED